MRDGLRTPVLCTLVLTVVGWLTLPDAQAGDLPQLRIGDIEAGKSYSTDSAGNTWAKVIQVIDDDNAIFGIDHGREANKPRYGTVIWVKCDTSKLSDDQTGFLANLIRYDKVTVSRTKYKTPTGASKTVFMFEKYKK